MDSRSPKHKVIRNAVGIFSANAVGGMMRVNDAEARIRKRPEDTW
jgi:hypothetical protein